MHDGTTPLILATRLAVEGMVEELINCQADPNAVDDFGMNTNKCYMLNQISRSISLKARTHRDEFRVRDIRRRLTPRD